MDKALRAFFKTGRELENIQSKAGKVRLPSVEILVREFREILTYRALAAEALDVYESSEIRKALTELHVIEQERSQS